MPSGILGQEHEPFHTGMYQRMAAPPRASLPVVLRDEAQTEGGGAWPVIDHVWDHASVASLLEHATRGGLGMGFEAAQEGSRRQGGAEGNPPRDGVALR
jgi:hypothetical protein